MHHLDVFPSRNVALVSCFSFSCWWSSEEPTQLIQSSTKSSGDLMSTRTALQSLYLCVCLSACIFRDHTHTLYRFLVFVSLFLFLKVLVWPRLNKPCSTVINVFYFCSTFTATQHVVSCYNKSKTEFYIQTERLHPFSRCRRRRPNLTKLVYRLPTKSNPAWQRLRKKKKMK